MKLLNEDVVSSAEVIRLKVKLDVPVQMIPGCFTTTVKLLVPALVSMVSLIAVTENSC